MCPPFREVSDDLGVLYVLENNCVLGSHQFYLHLPHRQGQAHCQRAAAHGMLISITNCSPFNAVSYYSLHVVGSW